MRFFLDLVDGFSRILLWVAVGLLVILVGTTIYEIVSRYVFNSPRIWSFDVAYFINGALFLFGGAFTLLKDRHVRIDILSSRFPAKVSRAVEALFHLLLFLPLITFVLAASVQQAWHAYATDDRMLSAWRPQIWPFYTMMSIGLLSLWLQSIAQVLRNLMGPSTSGGNAGEGPDVRLEDNA